MSSVDVPEAHAVPAPAAAPAAHKTPPIDAPSNGDVPTPTSHEKAPKVSDGSARTSFREQFDELQAWDQPANSAAVLVAGIVLFYLTSGEEAYSLVSLVCIAIAARVLVVAGGQGLLTATQGESKLRTLRTLLKKAVAVMENWLPIPSPQGVENVTHGVASVVEVKVNWLCRAMAQATHPTKGGHRVLGMLMLNLVLVTLLFKVLALRTLVFMFFLEQMIWPATYARFKTQIDNAYGKFWEHAQPYVEKAKVKANEVGEKLRATIADAFEKFKAKLRAPPKTEQTPSPAEKKAD